MDSTNNALSQLNQDTCSGKEFIFSETEDPVERAMNYADHISTETVPTSALSSEDSEFQQTSACIQAVPSEDTEEKWQLEPQDLLLLALKGNNFEKFCSLLKVPGVDPKFKYGKPYYTTCIELACRLRWGGRFAKILLDHGAKPNVHEVHQEPIHYAAKYGNPEALEALLQNKKTKVNVVDSSGRTALHHAVTYSKQGRDAAYERCIKLLLERPDLVLNMPNNNGYTAVHQAANISKKAVELILKYRKDDVDLDSYRTKGRTARECIESKYPELTPLLPKYRIKNQSHDLHNQLLSALQNGQVKTFHDILCRVDADGKARVDPNYRYGRPHFATCLEIACSEKHGAEFVKELLCAGADPNSVNPRTNQTALHVALLTRNIHALTVLLEDRRTNVNAVINEVMQLIAEHDQKRHTEETTQDIEETTQDIEETTQDIGETTQDIEETTQDIEETTQDIGETTQDIEETTQDIEETTQNNEEAKQYKEAMQRLKRVLERQIPEIRNAARKKRPHSGDMLSTNKIDYRSELEQTLFQHLYDRNCEDFKNKFSEEYKDATDENYTLLQYATLHSLEDAVRLLLESHANPNATTEFEKRSPILIACMGQDHEIMKLLLGSVTKQEFDVNAKDTKGNTALHHASKTEYLDCVVDLIKLGADIRHKNVFDKPPLPAKSVKHFLDKSLQTNDKFPCDEEYEIVFDYSFLVAYKEKPTKPSAPQECDRPLIKDHESCRTNVKSPKMLHPEMDFLYYISRSNEHRKLMDHPIITSFLHMKWQRVKLYFYINLSIYLTFALLLNSYILLKVAENRANGSESVISPNITQMTESNSTNTRFQFALWVFILLFLLYFTLRELLQIALSPDVYFTNYENILDFSVIFFSGYILFSPEWEEPFVVITIIASWSELILLTGRLPNLSTNIEMLKTVSLNYFWFLLSYIFLLIAFAFSFYSVLHKNTGHSSIKYNEPDDLHFFTNPYMSVMKTFVMMMGEFDSDSMVTKMSNSPTYCCLFALFVFIIAMVLLNLLTGLAVSDTQAIKSNAEQLSLVSRIRLIYEIESTLLQWHTFLEGWKKYKLLRPLITYHRSLLKDISLFPDTSREKRIHILPNKGPDIVFESYGLNKNKYDTIRATKARKRSIIRLPHILTLGSSSNGKNTSFKMTSVIIGKAIGVISNRGLESDVNYMKGNFSQIQDMLKETESKLSKIENKLEENQQLLEDYQQRLTDIGEQLQIDKIQSKDKENET
jgi:ankyrin repeat protein